MCCLHLCKVSIYIIRAQATIIPPFHQQAPGASSEPVSMPVFRWFDWRASLTIPNKPKQTINNGGRWVAIDIHGFANLHRHPNTVNPTFSCLAAISNMAVQTGTVKTSLGPGAMTYCRPPPITIMTYKAVNKIFILSKMLMD